jgi:hypothetical protein
MKHCHHSCIRTRLRSLADRLEGEREHGRGEPQGSRKHCGCLSIFTNDGSASPIIECPGIAPAQLADHDSPNHCGCEFPEDYHDPRIEPLKECTYHAAMRTKVMAGGKVVAEIRKEGV